MDNKIKNIEVDKFNIFNDIFNFVQKFAEKYKLYFNIDILIQSEDYMVKDLQVICNKILDYIYDVSFEPNDKEENKNEDLEKELEKEEIN